VIVDAATLSNNSVCLGHFLSGLASESLVPAVVCPADCDISAIPSPPTEIIIHPAFRLPFLRRQNRNKLLERLEKFKPTVLHCVGEPMAKLTQRLAHKLNLPYVLMIDAVPKRFPRLVISSTHCAAIITPAHTVSATLQKTYPNFAERIEQINMGTFVEDTCACFCVHSRIPGIVIAHPLDDVADFELVLGAIKHLAIDGLEFLLVIIGTGPAEERIHKLLTNLGLSQFACIIGDLQPARSVFAGTDIFIQPQPAKNFSPLILEAMSVGMAVAAPKGGVDDMIIEEKTAVIFDHTDELSIYATLQRLLDKREFARQIALAAQSHLRENHTVSKMLSSILQIYHNARQWMKR